MTADVTTRIARVLASAFEVAPRDITDATSPDTVEGWDSLTHIHLIAALEAEFGVSFSTDQALAMTSVGAIRTALAELGVPGAR